MRLIWTGGRPSVRAYTGATGPRLGMAVFQILRHVRRRADRHPRRASTERSRLKWSYQAPDVQGRCGQDTPPPLLSKELRTNLESEVDLLGFESALHGPMPAPQQSAITATHERQTSLNQPNSAIAKIMGLPALLRNSAGPKQPLRYRAVAVSFVASVKRPYRERKPLAPSKRQAGMRRKCPLRNA